jgi:hypothetical protein
MVAGVVFSTTDGIEGAGAPQEAAANAPTKMANLTEFVSKSVPSVKRPARCGPVAKRRIQFVTRAAQ